MIAAVRRNTILTVVLSIGCAAGLSSTPFISSSTQPRFAQIGTADKAKATAYLELCEYSVDKIPGAIPPLGVFDPLNFGGRADGNTLKRYREAELVHGRVAMLAVVGLIVGEAVEGSSFLFDSSVSGPAITHLTQVPAPFWSALLVFIAKIEIDRASYGWVPPSDVPVGEAGLLRVDYTPGDIGFDPLKLRPKNYRERIAMENKELQHGRLAMLGAAGMIAQEVVDHQGIIEHLTLALNAVSV